MKYLLLLAVILSNLFWLTETKAQTTTVRPITFPVIGAVSYYDDFGQPRAGHTHEGNDLIGKKMMPLVSVVNGTIRSVVYPEATWGYSVTIEDADGYRYHYLHMNNDIPGTDNGQGGGMNAYAADIKPGNKVVAGQLIGYMGDSGNAESTSSHLHFEIRRNGEVFSPYASLQAAVKINAPVDYPALVDEILPYGGFQGGASVAVGNLDADADPEIVTGAGPGGGPHIQIFDRGGPNAKFGFFAYLNTFTGGVDVAVADIDGDGIDEIITGSGRGADSTVKVFKADGLLVLSFMAYTPGFLGGIRVAAADLNNDGKAEIVTGPASGGGAHVKIFQYDGSLSGEFMAYEGFTGGIDVAVIKATSSTPGRIITSPNIGGGPHIKTFDITGAMQSQFMAYDEVHRGGVRVSATSGQIITAPLNGGPDFRKFDFSGTKLDNDTAFEEWWMGSWDIAVYNTTVFVSTASNTRRRTSVRELDFQPNRRFRFENENPN